MKSAHRATDGVSGRPREEGPPDRPATSPSRTPRRRAGAASGAWRVGLLATAVAVVSVEAMAQTPSAPPCNPDPGVGFEVRPNAAVLDYHFTGDGDGFSWNDADNWSFGSWAGEAASNAGVPAINESETCITEGGDTGGPFTSYPRVLIDAGQSVQILSAIPSIGELEIATGATVFLQTDLTELISDFGNPDVGGSIETDGSLIIGAGTSTPLPGATITANGILRLGAGATITMDAGAVFSGAGEIQLLGADIVVTENLDVGVELVVTDDKSGIRGLPGAPFQRLTIGDGLVDPGASLDLGIAIDGVDIEGIFAVEGQLFLRATQTRVDPPVGTLVAASPAGRITTQQDTVNTAIELVNANDVFVQTGAALAITGTVGAFDAEDVRFENQVDGTLVVQEGGLITTENPPVADVPFLFSFGRVDLGGDIRGTLRSAGLLRIGVPASDPDIATITGDLELFVNSALQIDIDGLQPESGHDQLIVGGTAELDGALDVTSGLFFSLEPTDGFALIEASSVVGTFSSVSGDEGLPVTYEPTRVYLGGDPDFPDTSDWLQPSSGAQLPLAEDPVSLCLDEAGLHFDVVLGLAPGIDFTALRLSSGAENGFNDPDENIAFNTFARSGEPDPNRPQPLVQTDPGYVGPDRWVDGILAQTSFSDLGNGFFRFRGLAPSGDDRYQNGDTLDSLATRATSNTPSNPPSPDGFGTSTFIYRIPDFAPLLTITERPICVPEPGSSALAWAALTTLGGIARLRRVSRGSHASSSRPSDPQ
ncbi:MAG: hypothetical protein ACX98W_17850 [bacterium]